MSIRSHAPPRGCWWWAIRILVGVLALFFVFGSVVWRAGHEARSTLARRYPAVGKLVDVGGYRLHIYCLGEGGPTVILDAGASDFSVQWSLVQPQVATFTHVCVYDRAGFGWSDPSPYARTSDIMVEELHTLLLNAQVPGPYVLVGHSLGGMNVRLYAYRYPDEVSGMVLVDALHEAQFLGSPFFWRVSELLLRLAHLLPPMDPAWLLALLPEQIPVRGLTGEAAEQYRAVLATTPYLAAALAECGALNQSCALVREAQIAGLGNIPLIVISRQVALPLPGLSESSSRQFEEEWHTLQSDMLLLSPNSRLVIAEQSGHHIQLARPDVVTDAIREVVMTVREGRESLPP